MRYVVMGRLGGPNSHTLERSTVGILCGTTIGCRGLLVHAESADARDFYRHLVAEFQVSPTDELHLVLLVEDIVRTLRP